MYRHADLSTDAICMMPIIAISVPSPPQKSSQCSDELNGGPILAQETFLLGRRMNVIKFRYTLTIQGGNDEVWNRCAQSFLKIIMIEYLTSILVRLGWIRYSLFDIRYLSASGGFAFSEFLFRFDRPFFWPAVGLTPET